MGRRTLAAGALLLVAAGAAAQDGGGRFGVAVAGVGDVNGDGLPDLVVGAPEARPGGRYDAGRATVFSSKDGAVLFAFSGASSVEAFGTAVAGLGDVNGDGRPDIAVGAPRAREGKGTVRAFSGKDGSVLWEVVGYAKGEAFGTTLAVAGALESYGTLSLIAGSPSATVGERNSCGLIRELSGEDGHIFGGISGLSVGQSHGGVLSGTGDLNGDGVSDFAAGSTPAPDEGDGKGSPLLIYSGSDFSHLLRIPAAGRPSQVASVAVIEDRNPGGGKRLALGAPMAMWNGLMAGGVVRVVSPADGKELAKWHGKTVFDAFGFAMAATADANGDGITDLWVTSMGGEAVAEEQGKPKDPAGRIDLVSGKDGAVIRTIRSTKFGEMLGASLAVPGDLNKDGVPDLLAGAPGAGVARVYSGKDGSVLLTLTPPPEK